MFVIDELIIDGTFQPKIPRTQRTKSLVPNRVLYVFSAKKTPFIQPPWYTVSSLAAPETDAKASKIKCASRKGENVNVGGIGVGIGAKS